MDLTAASGLAGFALTALLIELTPGPNMAWLAVLAASEGRRVGLAAVAGVALGLGVIGALAALGLAALINGSDLAYQALRWVGVAWLFYLAFDAWRAADTGPDAPTSMALGRAFRRGLVTNLLNPKAAVFYVTVLPDFARGQQGYLTLAAIYVVVATAVHAAIVITAGTSRHLLEDAGRARIVRRALAVALAGVAVWMLVRT